MSKVFKSDPSGLAVSEPHGFLSLTTIWLNPDVSARARRKAWRAVALAGSNEPV